MSINNGIKQNMSKIIAMGVLVSQVVSPVRIEGKEITNNRVDSLATERQEEKSKKYVLGEDESGLLAGIEINGVGKFDQEFRPDTYEYTGTTYMSTDILRVKATPMSIDAIVTVNGEQLQAGQSINLPITVGSNDIEVKVTYNERETNYQFRITKLNEDYRGRTRLQYNEDYTVTVTSEKEEHTVDKMFDGNKETYWQAEDTGQQDMLITLKNPMVVSKIKNLEFEESNIGLIRNYQILTSMDNENFTTVIRDGQEVHNMEFEMIKAKYVKVVIKSTHNEPCIIRELEVYKDKYDEVPEPIEQVEEYTPIVPDNPYLSRSAEKMIEKGIEVGGWTAPGGTGRAYYLEDEFNQSNMTSAVFYEGRTNREFFKYNPNVDWSMSLGPFGLRQEGIGIGYYGQREFFYGPDAVEQEGRVNRLVTACIGDENDYSPKIVNDFKGWMNLARELYPHVLTHSNQWAFQWNEEQLQELMEIAKPDLLTHDWYYWTEAGSDINATDMLLSATNYQRELATLGHDGSGEQPIVFGQYVGVFKQGTNHPSFGGWYESTESQKMALANLSLTLGMKWFNLFRIEYATEYFYLMDEDGAPTHHFYEWAKAFEQINKLSPYLVRLNTDYVVVKPGQHKKDGVIKENNISEGWRLGQFGENESKNKEYYIESVVAQNKGQQNNGLPGDVVIGYFESLPGYNMESDQLFGCTQPKAFMITNSLTVGNGTRPEHQYGASYDTAQKITVTVNKPEGTRLMRINKNTGNIEDFTEQLIPISEGVGNYEMALDLGGGEAELFFWEENSGVSSSGYDTIHSSLFAFDSIETTVWKSEVEDQTPYIQKIFDVPTKLSSITIKEASGNVTKYKVKYLDTNGVWRYISEVEGKGIQEVEKIKFEEIEASGFKIEFETSGQIEIKEVYENSAKWIDIEAENGKVKINVDKKPSFLPTPGEVGLKAYIGGQVKELTVENISYSISEQCIIVDFKEIERKQVEQVVELVVSYEEQEKITTFMIEKLSDPVIHWKLEEGEGANGTHLKDEMGYAQMTLQTETVDSESLWIEGRKRGTRALYFNGLNTSTRIDKPAIESEWTMSTWIKREDGTARGDSSTLLSRIGTQQGEAAIVIESWERGGGNNGFTGKMGVGMCAISDNNINYSLPIDEWINLTLVRQGQRVIVYENGVYKAEVECSGGRPDLPLGILGAFDVPGLGYFKGAIDEVIIYPIALTQTEVENIVQADKETLISIGMPGEVKEGQTFKMVISINELKENLYAQDLTIKYNPDLLILKSIKGVGTNRVVNHMEAKLGEVRILGADEKGSTTQKELMILDFEAEPGTASQEAKIEIMGIEMGTVNSGEANVIGIDPIQKSIQIKKGDVELDKTDLENLITEAQSIYTEAIVGNEPGQYPELAKEELGTSIKLARQELENITTQEEINRVFNELEQAIKNFKETMIKEYITDINLDGKTDVADMALIAYYYTTQEGAGDNWEEAKKADVNRDGRVGVEDLSIVANAILQEIN